MVEHTEHDAGNQDSQGSKADFVLHVDTRPDNPMKFDHDAVPVQLLPTISLVCVAKVFGYGAKKYAANSWRNRETKAVSWMRTYGSIIRHLLMWAAGQDKDPESGMSHLWHAGTQLMILIEHVETGEGTDDRHKNSQEHTEKLLG